MNERAMRELAETRLILQEAFAPLLELEGIIEWAAQAARDDLTVSIGDIVAEALELLREAKAT